ncbi:hypothetical protein MmiAt1_14550 [Methanimicrococcus sp. At1]|uniref:YcxB-like C-terminal domain-containing protein n=2 Tax=Methanimicrococcus hacksteinii TaxID=3028293 RepID=A0ABU3VSH3_9EURY|nr:hypothetical protein [Methanimicrococcus sp. At1]
MNVKVKTGLNIGEMETLMAEKYKIHLIGAVVIPSLCLILPGIIFLLLFYNIGTVRKMSILLIVLGILLIPFSYLTAPMIQKNMRNLLMKKENKAVIEYEVTETELIQNVTRQNGALETKTYKYSMLDSAEEKKNEFIIYVTKMQVFLLPKKDIIEGTPEELSVLLRNEFGSKFKKLN